MIVGASNSAYIISLFAFWLDPQGQPLIYYVSPRKGLFLLIKTNLVPEAVEVRSEADHNACLQVVRYIADHAPKHEPLRPMPEPQLSQRIHEVQRYILVDEAVIRRIYNRQLDTSTSFEPDWEHGPPSRPDYTIEREKPLEIRQRGALIWREPPVVLDAKYYLGGSDPTNTHSPIKKLLGDMTLLSSQVGVLFFPQLPEPEGEQQVTRIVKRTGKSIR